MDGTEQVLPYDLIETILFRLPAKSLLRFKAVCKQWSAIISDDPIFAETHLQLQSKLHCLYLQEKQSLPAFTRGFLENGQFRRLSALEYPPANNSGIIAWCHCDGLFLILISRDSNRDKISYVLWNPSCRIFKKFRCPYPLKFSKDSMLIAGICYDPFLKDYKVVVGDESHYAVFYCKRNSWSEMKDYMMMENEEYLFVKQDCCEGVTFKGSIYWVSSSNSRLVCFDGGDETIKGLRYLDTSSDYSHSLISSPNGLCLLSRLNDDDDDEMVTMIEKFDGNAWKEYTVKLPLCYDNAEPLYSTQENKIIFNKFGDFLVVTFDSERCFEIIQISAVELPRTDRRGCTRLFPYLENIFCFN